MKLGRERFKNNRTMVMTFLSWLYWTPHVNEAGNQTLRDPARFARLSKVVVLEALLGAPVRGM